MPSARGRSVSFSARKSAATAVVEVRESFRCRRLLPSSVRGQWMHAAGRTGSVKNPGPLCCRVGSRAEPQDVLRVQDNNGEIGVSERRRADSSGREKMARLSAHVIQTHSTPSSKLRHAARGWPRTIDRGARTFRWTRRG
jgi:hypothetical protein